jgi:Uma2 family endonuclease
MPETTIKIGPRDQGRRMSLQEFDRAEGVEGYLYELNRGVVVVMDVPADKHFAQVDALREQLYLYRASHPGAIHRIGGSLDCKILLTDLESERHPDVTVYKKPRPAGKDYWASWVPDLVIEVVSPGSEERDYVEKREEYLAFGVREYWIVDADKGEVLVLRRRGSRWVEQVVRPPEIYQPRLLPGFAFDCARVFQAAEDAGG